MDKYKYLKYKYKYQELCAKINQQAAGAYMYDKFRTSIQMRPFLLDKYDSGNGDTGYSLTLGAKEKTHIASPTYLITNIKKFDSGASGDSVFSCTYYASPEKTPVRCVFKVFRYEDWANAECNSSNMCKKIGLAAHTPNIRLYGKIPNISKLYANDNKSYYFTISDFIEGDSLQKIIGSTCCNSNKSNDPKVVKSCIHYMGTDSILKKSTSDVEKENIKMIILQIFYIIYRFKLNGINHCDLHGDNILITPITNPIYIKIFDCNYKISNFKVMIIDLDIMRNVKFSRGFYTLCPGKKPREIGTHKIRFKSRDLITACGNFAKDTEKEHLITKQKSTPNSNKNISIAEDGDMWYFTWMLKLFNDIYLFSINMEAVTDNISLFSERVLNNKIKERSVDGLSKYYIKCLKKLKDIIFSPSTVDVTKYLVIRK